jgi:2-methylisocitrate lyase-like PEP mutase family enzyme
VIEAGGIGVNIEDGIDPATHALRPPHVAAERIAATRAVAKKRESPVHQRAPTSISCPRRRRNHRFEEAAQRLAQYGRAERMARSSV